MDELAIVATDRKFWSRVDIRGEDECWEWQGALNRDGYGSSRPHRKAYRLAKSDPGKRYVLHSCDNRCCCNPRHLFVGSQSQNMKQKFERGRHTDFRRKLRLRDVRELIDLVNSGMSQENASLAFGITEGHVRNIIGSRKWPNIPDEVQLELLI